MAAENLKETEGSGYLEILPNKEKTISTSDQANRRIFGSYQHPCRVSLWFSIKKVNTKFSPFFLSLTFFNFFENENIGFYQIKEMEEANTSLSSQILQGSSCFEEYFQLPSMVLIH